MRGRKTFSLYRAEVFTNRLYIAIEMSAGIKESCKYHELCFLQIRNTSLNTTLCFSTSKNVICALSSRVK